MMACYLPEIHPNACTRIWCHGVVYYMQALVVGIVSTDHVSVLLLSQNDGSQLAAPVCISSKLYGCVTNISLYVDNIALLSLSSLSLGVPDPATGAKSCLITFHREEDLCSPSKAQSWPHQPLVCMLSTRSFCLTIAYGERIQTHAYFVFLPIAFYRSKSRHLISSMCVLTATNESCAHHICSWACQAFKSCLAFLIC